MNQVLFKFYNTFNIKKYYQYYCAVELISYDGSRNKLNLYFNREDFIDLIVRKQIGYETFGYVKLLQVKGNYQNINDFIYLELISILNKHLAQGLGTCLLVNGNTADEVKKDILYNCIKCKNIIYDDVKSLF